MAQSRRPSSPAARAALILGAGLVLLAGGIGLWLWQGERIAGTVVSDSGEALVGGHFELVDQHGTVRRDTDFAGQYLLVYFGYTYCPDVCPTSLAIMSAALEELGPAAERITPVFVTVDPERDTVDQLKDYASHFHPRLVALTGTPEQVAQAAKAYRVYFAKAADGGDDGTYLMDHSSITYLMGLDGRYVTHFPHGTSAEEMAAGLAKIVASGG
jgi:protein SCO1/2